VNVGKGNRVPIADFRSLLEAQGCTAVRTLLNSGNALCDSPVRTASALGTRIHSALHRELGLDVQVVVKTATEFATVVAEQSIQAPAEHHSRLLVLFAQDKQTIIDLSALSRLLRAPERLIVGREAAYLWCPDGILQSNAANASVGKAGRAVTTRNWATVLKLEGLLNERAKQATKWTRA
jgi:uncharacterized protein (DUF1697 family)